SAVAAAASGCAAARSSRPMISRALRAARRAGSMRCGPTGGYAQKMSSIPAATSASTSAAVAAVRPTAPASSWSRATSALLEVFQCGRSATSNPRATPAIWSMFRRSVGRSISTAGVGRSGNGRPIRADGSVRVTGRPGRERRGTGGGGARVGEASGEREGAPHVELGVGDVAGERVRRLRVVGQGQQRPGLTAEPDVGLGERDAGRAAELAVARLDELAGEGAVVALAGEAVHRR